MYTLLVLVGFVDLCDSEPISSELHRNSRGYELAKRFNSKFTHLSPVWYDLKR